MTHKHYMNLMIQYKVYVDNMARYMEILNAQNRRAPELEQSPQQPDPIARPP